MGYCVSIAINAKLSVVWDAWASAEQTSAWLAPRANVVFEEGRPYEFFWDDDPHRDSTIGCRMVRITPNKQLIFEWQGKTEFLSLFLSPRRPTIIEVSFCQKNEAIEVTLEQRETRDLPLWSEYDRWMSSAWAHALGNLKAYCENAEKD